MSGMGNTTLKDSHADLYGGRDKIIEELPSIQLLGVIEPSQIAKIATFLASDDSSCMTGSPIIADGGITAGA